MPIGRPRNPGTEAERAEARRAKVRVNVQAFRRREKEKKLAVEAQSRLCRDQELLYPLDYRSGSEDSLRTSPSPSWQDQETDYAAPDLWIWQWSSDLENDATYGEIFLSAIQRRSIPYDEAGERIVYEPCKRFLISSSTWIEVGTLELGAPSLQIMNDAVLASALTVIGRSRGDANMSMRGALVQSRALRGLRIALQKVASEEDVGCCTTLPMQALTCAVSELLANHDWGNFASHLAGVGALIAHCGPGNLKGRDVREHFYSYRSLQAAFSFTYGHASFLGDPEWIEPSWKREVELARHPLHAMLDVAFKLVPEMNRGEGHQTRSLSDLRERLERLQKVTSDLDKWERNLSLNQGGRLYHQRDAIWPGLYDYAFDFASLSVGIAFAMYTGVRIKLAWVTKQVMLEIVAQDPGASVDVSEPIWEGLKWSRQALQCIEYFHTGRCKASGKIVTLFPLDSAWNFISDVHAEGRIDLTEEQQWCLATAHRLSTLDIVVFHTW